MAGTTHLASSSNEILNSWKEISAHLGRGVRTAQRWERELGLPVRRPRGKHRSAVIAIRKELDVWLACSPRIREQVGYSEFSASNGARMLLQTSLQARSALHEELRRQCTETSQVMQTLMTNLRNLQQACSETKEDLPTNVA